MTTDPVQDEADRADKADKQADAQDIFTIMAENELCNDIELFECFLQTAIDVKEPSTIAGLPPMISTVKLLQFMLAKGDVAALTEIRRRFIACNQDFINRKIQELME
jgi:hypothetical protein